MNKRLNKIVSFVLVVCMLLTLMPAGIFNNVFGATKTSTGTNNDNWTMSYNLNDVTNGQTPIDNIIWDATTQTKKVYKLTISYENPTPTKDYAPGDIQFEIDSILDNIRDPSLIIENSTFSNSSGSYGYEVEYFIDANKSTDTNKTKPWSYSVETTGKTHYNVPTKFIVTNNDTIEKNVSFSGTLSITFTLDSNAVVNNSSGSYGVELKTKDGTHLVAEPFDFSYTSNTVPYYLILNTEKFHSPSGLPGEAEDYLWVKYNFTYTNETASGVREAFDKYLKITAPAGALVYDKNFNPITAESNNTYNVGYYDEKIIRETFKEFLIADDLTKTVIVAYPRSTTTTINLTGSLYGTYRDESSPSLLSEQSYSYAASEFDFDYEGELYYIGKTTRTTTVPYSQITSATGGLTKWYLHYGARYSEEVGSINMICGDDILYAQDADYNWYRLTDSEYSITGFKAAYNASNQEVPYGLVNMNTLADVSSKYDVEVHVRYANSTTYTLWKTGKLTTDGILNDLLTFPENVVGVQFKVLNSDNEDIELDGELSIKIHSTNTAKDSLVYNFDYLDIQQNSNGQYVELDITEDNYLTHPTKEHIIAYDRSTYGKLMFRNTDNTEIGFAQVHHAAAKSLDNSSLTVDAENEIISFNYTFSNIFYMSKTVVAPDEFYGFAIYDLLPEGIELAATAEELETIFATSFYASSSYKSVSGSRMTSTFLRNAITVNIIENYKNTNRTYFEIVFDFSDDPLDLTYTYGLLESHMANMSDSQVIGYNLYQDARIPCQLTFDDWYNYGATYSNYIYITDLNYTKSYDMTINQYKMNSYPNSTFAQLKDNGYLNSTTLVPELVDLDQDGDTDERIGVTGIVSTLGATINTHTSIVKMISSDGENYTKATQTLPYDSPYSYRLRVINGEDNKATNLVVFDSIEKDSPGWKGTVTGFDTSLVEAKGYSVKIYYNTTELADGATLPQDLTNSFWSEYVEGVTDPSTIKHVAFKFLNNTGDAPATVDPGIALYVIINMRTPNTTVSVTTANPNANITANGASFAVDLLNVSGGVEKQVTLPSNIVYANLPQINVKIMKFVPGLEDLADYEHMLMDPYEKYYFDIKITRESTGGVLNGGPIRVQSQLQADGRYSVSQINLSNVVLGDKYIIEEILPADSQFELEEMTITAKNAAGQTVQLTGASLQLNNGKYELVVDKNISSDMTFEVRIYNEIIAKSIDLNINKIIEGTDRAFEYHNASRNDEFNFDIKLTNKADNTFKRGTLSSTNGLTINDIYPGTYIIEETNLDDYWIFKSMAAAGILDGVTLTQVNGKYELTIANTVVDDSVYSINITNELTKPTQINLSISKTISGTDRAFELLDYTRDDTFSFPVSIQHQTNNTDSQTGTVTNKTAVTFNNLNVGKYLITETVPENWVQTAITSSNSVNGVTLTKEGDNYYINIAENATDGATFSIVINNELQETREPTIKIVFSKEIVGTVAAFENLKLDPNGEYAFQMNVVNGNYRIHGIVTNRQNLTFAEVPIGTYVVTETKDFKFDFVQMQALNSIAGVTFEKIGNQYILTVGEDITDRSTLLVKVTNEVRPDAYYDGKDDKVNLFVWNHEENG